MSPTLGPGKTTWSECSRQYLDKFVLTPQATCVLGRSSHVNIIQQFIPSHQLPGQRFSLNDQCQFRFGPTARHYNGQPKREICRVIKCHVKPNHLHTSHRKNGGYYPSTGRSIYNPYPPKSTYNTHPALEGTDCGDQMVNLSFFTFYLTNAFYFSFSGVEKVVASQRVTFCPLKALKRVLLFRAILPHRKQILVVQKTTTTTSTTTSSHGQSMDCILRVEETHRRGQRRLRQEVMRRTQTITTIIITTLHPN